MGRQVDLRPGSVGWTTPTTIPLKDEVFLSKCNVPSHQDVKSCSVDTRNKWDREESEVPASNVAMFHEESAQGSRFIFLSRAG